MKNELFLGNKGRIMGKENGSEKWKTTNNMVFSFK